VDPLIKRTRSGRHYTPPFQRYRELIKGGYGLFRASMVDKVTRSRSAMMFPLRSRWRGRFARPDENAIVFGINLDPRRGAAHSPHLPGHGAILTLQHKRDLFGESTGFSVAYRPSNLYFSRPI